MKARKGLAAAVFAVASVLPGYLVCNLLLSPQSPLYHSATIQQGTLSVTPADAESMNSWSNQTKSHFGELFREIQQAEKANNDGAMVKDLRAFARYGEEHPPPGVDRRGFLDAMNDVSEMCDAFDALNVSAVKADASKFQNDSKNLTALPSWWTSGNFG